MSPFNESYYKDLLDGLDAAEVRVSDVNSGDVRIDSEYFQKAFLDNAACLRNHAPAAEFCAERKLRSVKKLYLAKKFNYLEISRIAADGGYATIAVSPDCVPDRADVILHNGDVAVSLVRPNRNAVALIRSAKRTVGSSGLLILRSANIMPEYLFAYCKTRHFRIALTRESRATMYPAVSKADALKTLIFNASADFQRQIGEVVKQSVDCLCRSQNEMQTASDMLLSELGLDKWRADGGSVSVKSLRTVQATNRWDAEYYLPKYDDIMNALRRVPHRRLGEIASIKKSIEPGSKAYRESGIPFVRVADLSQFGVAVGDKFLDESEYEKEIAALSPRKNTILFSKDGTLGIAYKMEEDMRAITSGAILHLTARRGINPDYLALALNAMPTQMQAERDSGGAIIQHWRPDQICDVVVPLPSVAAQETLAAEAQKSFNFRRKSRMLLHAAKAAVETAIEKGEKAALRQLAQSAATEESD